MTLQKAKDMADVSYKASVLVEALPYIRNFRGKTFVIKYGGSAQVDAALKAAFAEDIALLSFIGVYPVVVHGGGPKISATMQKMGKKPSFVQGQRVTDRETMDIVEMVLGGLINKEIVALINGHGGKAMGLSGKDGGFIKAKKKLLKKTSPETGADEIMDIGLVGEITSVEPGIIQSLQKEGFIPVIAPIGVGPRGETLNINADYVAASVSGAVAAEKLILLTDVPGVLDRKGNVVSTLNTARTKRLLSGGGVSGGMLPKLQACLKALSGGTKSAHIIDGRVPHCLLLEIFTEKGIGTLIA